MDMDDTKHRSEFVQQSYKVTEKENKKKNQ